MEMINKKGFIDVIATVNSLKKVEAEKALDAVLAGLEQVVSDGNGLQLLGYITLKIKEVAESTRANPQNREEMVTTPAHNAVKIKAGSKLQDLAN